MGEYRRFQQEQQARGQMPQTRGSTVTGDVLVPTLQGATIGLTAAGVVTGILALCGASWSAAWRWGAGIGLGAFGATVILFILHHHGANVVEPIRLAYHRLSTGRPALPIEDEWQSPMIVNRFNTPAIPATLESAVRSIEPQVDPQVKALYDFLVNVWPAGNVSRRACADLGFTRRTWERYVGGQRGKEGQESGRGVLERAGCVVMGSNGWEIAASLDQALSINKDLAEYAEKRARLVVGRDGLGLGRDRYGARFPSHHRGAGEG